MIQKNEEEFHQKHSFIPQINKKNNDKKRKSIFKRSRRISTKKN